MTDSRNLTAEDLVQRFSWQFKEGPRIDGSIPPRWNSILYDLMLAVEELLSIEEREGFWWTDIKEKRGELRAYCVYPNERDTQISSLVDRAEKLVSRIQHLQ